MKRGKRVPRLVIRQSRRTKHILGEKGQQDKEIEVETHRNKRLNKTDIKNSDVIQVR